MAAAASGSGVPGPALWRPVVVRPGVLDLMYAKVLANRLEKLMEDGFPLPPDMVAQGELPELYPAPPPWLRFPPPGPQRFIAAIGLPDRFIAAGGLAAELLIEQRLSDRSWEELAEAYRAIPGGPTARLPFKTHVKLFSRAGFVLWDKRARKQDCHTFEEIVRGGPNGAVIERKSAGAERTHLRQQGRAGRICGACGKRCKAECRCGQGYCDRECQRRDWPEHARTCQEIVEAQPLGVAMTKLSWATVAADVDSDSEDAGDAEEGGSRESPSPAADAVAEPAS
eukprot:tig00001286_g8025.t1